MNFLRTLLPTLLILAVIAGISFALTLTDLGTYDNSPKRVAEVVNANNTAIEAVLQSSLTTNQTFLSVTGTTNTMVISNGVICAVN